MQMITARKAGLDLSIDQLEIHFLSGGNVQRVVNALISADKAQIPLTFQQATAIDLAGRDVFEAVQVSVNPKVITTPKVAAMAKDGIQLLALARVNAFMHGRTWALPGDVKEIFADATRHRIARTVRAQAENVSADAIVEDVLAAVPIP